MHIVMMTNTYTPHVGGVAGSVLSFTQGYRARGHRVLVVAPEFEGMPEDEEDVVRIPAIQHFNGSDFSVVLPAPGRLTETLNEFQPDIVHSHHPFLLGDTALRVVASRNIPLVFTHHTMYEQYTHYVPGDSPPFARFIKTLGTGYANLCDRVIAPSESVANVLKERGVTTRINVIPTGVDVEKFKCADGASFRRQAGIPADAFLVGHVGRLAPEKNLEFLTEAVCAFLVQRPEAHFLVVGGGPSTERMRVICAETNTCDRVHFVGKLTGVPLVQAYTAMDVFAFSSKSETQGMVLTEAMAAGVPVVALDAPGAREVVRNTSNGRLLKRQDLQGFAAALEWVYSCPAPKRLAMSKSARKTAAEFSCDRCVEKALMLYGRAITTGHAAPDHESTPRPALLRAVADEWQLWSNRFSAAAAMFSSSDQHEAIP
ncbi:MAG: glycosyltransferase [FCB group bacterium]|nr:glycosyltransferase [FCB group bacterium]